VKPDEILDATALEKPTVTFHELWKPFCWPNVD